MSFTGMPSTRTLLKLALPPRMNMFVNPPRPPVGTTCDPGTRRNVSDNSVLFSA